MAKKAGNDPSKMSIADLGRFLDGADKRLGDMRHALAVEESNVQIFRHELGKRLGLNAGPAAATRKGRKGAAAPKAKAKKGGAAADPGLKTKVKDWFNSHAKPNGPKEVATALSAEATAVRTAMLELRSDGFLTVSKKNGPWPIMAKV